MILFDKLERGARRLAKAAYLRLLFVTGALRRARLRAARQGVVAITLHRVLADEAYASGKLQPGMAVRASTFEHFLQYITSRCEWILPGQGVPLQAGGSGSRRPRIALTFDDGWKDNYEVAFPISRKHGVGFTIFLCPRIMNRKDSFWTDKVQDLWWAAQQKGKLDLLSGICGAHDTGSADSLVASLKHAQAGERETLIAELQSALHADAAAGRPYQLLDWSEVKDMSRAGIVFGSHTASHAILTDVSPDEAVRELRESKSDIEAKLSSCTWFAYPNGDWSPAVRDLVKQSGYQAAFTNAPGIWRADGNVFSIPRVNVWEGSLVGLDGGFSRIALEYAIFWKADRASSRQVSSN